MQREEYTVGTWCVHLLFRRCMDEAGREGLIPYNPVHRRAAPKYAPTVCAWDRSSDTSMRRNGSTFSQ